MKNKAVTQQQIKLARTSKMKPWGLDIGLPQSLCKSIRSFAERIRYNVQGNYPVVHKKENNVSVLQLTIIK